MTRSLPTLITSAFDGFRGERARHRSDDGRGRLRESTWRGRTSLRRTARAARIRARTCTAASTDDFARRQEAAGGRIVLVTLAPEVPGALPLIEQLVSAGVRVAIGHSAASPAQIADAIAAGATLSTHLGNGCASVLPRHPNVIWEQLAADAALREPDSRRSSLAGSDGESDGACQGPRPNDSRDRRHRRRRLRARHAIGLAPSNASSAPTAASRCRARHFSPGRA